MLVDEYSNTYHNSIDKNLLKLIILLCLKKIETNSKSLNLKLVIEAELESIKNIFSKGSTENCSREIFLIDSVLLTTP